MGSQCRALASNQALAGKKSSLPQIHWGIWPSFCPKHLVEDPDGCSSWDEDKRGNVKLDFVLNGTATAYFDPKLIGKIRNQLDLIPKNPNKLCSYGRCLSCNRPVIQGLFYEENEYDDNTPRPFLMYKCECTDYWLEDCVSDKEDIAISEKWTLCRRPTIYSYYVDWHHQTYFHFLEGHLAYVSENPSCNCYWPQVNSRAKDISDLTYNQLLIELKEHHLEDIAEIFSPFLKKRTHHGFICGLLSHAFFYSDYRTILRDLDNCASDALIIDAYPLVHSRLTTLEAQIRDGFLPLYNHCLEKHPHPKIYYERGMVLFHRGENIDSLEDIRHFISYAENNNYQNLLTSDLYFNEGRLLNESLSYDEAIIALTKAIEKNPKNEEAYFERAIAFFEKGDFETAFSDYLTSGIQSKQLDSGVLKRFDSLAFGQNLALGIVKGGKEATEEFIPSLLSSFRGLGRGIWACVSNPLQVSQNLIESSKACLESLPIALRKMDSELIPELQKYAEKWHSMNEAQKGELMGYVIGKYGIDIFIGSESIKTIQLYRDLRRANALMTFETASVSAKHAKEVLDLCAKEWKFRNDLLNKGRLKIDWGSQGKHIIEKHNYILGKSILEHPNPQMLIECYAGSGRKVNNVLPGTPSYKEVVDFKEHIGIWINKEKTIKLPTTKGTIHYSSTGCHIVPAKP